MCPITAAGAVWGCPAGSISMAAAGMAFLNDEVRRAQGSCRSPACGSWGDSCCAGPVVNLDAMEGEGGEVAPKVWLLLGDSREGEQSLVLLPPCCCSTAWPGWSSFGLAGDYLPVLEWQRPCGCHCVCLLLLPSGFSLAQRLLPAWPEHLGCCTGVSFLDLPVGQGQPGLLSGQLVLQCLSSCGLSLFKYEWQ